MPPIRAITFDVGGTLMHPWPSVGHVYAEVASHYGIRHVSPEKLNSRFAAAWKSRRDFRHTREHWAALVTEVFEMDSGQVQVFFPELYERFGGAESWRLFDDVLPALNALASLGIDLAVISNWDERLRPLLFGLGLGRYFETVIVSCETGFTKPSSVMFELAARKLGTPPESILHVGDDFDRDTMGAKAAGFQALLIDRAGAQSGGERIRSLADLEKLALAGRYGS